MRLGLVPLLAWMVVSCGSSHETTPEPICLSVRVNLQAVGNRTDWTATACAGSVCKTGRELSCDGTSDCKMSGDEIVFTFDFPTRDDIPTPITGRIVSDSGEVLFDKQTDFIDDFGFAACDYYALLA